MPAFDPSYPVASLRGAPYNPRRIESEEFERLRESIRSLGVVRPLIAVASGTLVAGHQRLRALQAEGLTHAPVYLLDDLAAADEIRFNQMHNGTDTDMDATASVGPGPVGWGEVPGGSVVGKTDAQGAELRHEMVRLMSRYGTWGGCVANEDGEVLAAAQYALACWQTNAPCRVYRIANEKTEDARRVLRASYGIFDYSAVPRKPWHQTFCQPIRLDGNGVSSYLYEQHVLPDLRPGERVLDFGCGTGAYAKRLRAIGVNTLGMEFYPRVDGALDRGVARSMARELLQALREKGRFDVVLADTVVNATGSVESARDVLLALSALCRPGGRVHVSGLAREDLSTDYRRRVSANKSGHIRRLAFPDENGLSANYVRGEWLFQLFQTEEEVRTLLREVYATEPVRFTRTWGATLKHSDPHPEDVLLAAIRREFDLVYPDGKTLGMTEEAVTVVRDAIRASRA